LAGETEVLGEKPPQRHFVHHKSHTTWFGLEPWSTRWEGGDALLHCLCLLSIHSSLLQCCFILYSHFLERLRTTMKSLCLALYYILWNVKSVNAELSRFVCTVSRPSTNKPSCALCGSKLSKATQRASLWRVQENSNAYNCSVVPQSQTLHFVPGVCSCVSWNSEIKQRLVRWTVNRFISLIVIVFCFCEIGTNF
jgi:hypothetical protein